VHCEHPSPDIDFTHSPLYVNTELKPWNAPPDTPRRAGVSAFGFGGTNFHLVLEEHIPHRLTGNGKRTDTVSVPTRTAPNEAFMNSQSSLPSSPSASANKAPLRGALLLGANSQEDLIARLRTVINDAKSGRTPTLAPPSSEGLRAPLRLAIDYADTAELADKATKALTALAANQPALWKALRAQGVFRGAGPAAKVAFLYTGQGSQYVNMLRPLCASEPIIADTFAEADRVMKPLLGKPLSEFIFVDSSDPKAVAKAEDDLRQTAITQPAVLAADIGLTRLLAAYGIEPDFTMGHSLGEYGALVASGALPFAEALEAVSARGREMTRFSPADRGRLCPIARDRTSPENDRWLYRHRQHQQRAPGRHRRRQQGSRAGDRSIPESWLRNQCIAGQPRVPHLHRRLGE
jgi:acyl transferase domain-containing protein